MRHSECLYIWIKRIMVFFVCCRWKDAIVVVVVVLVVDAMQVHLSLSMLSMTRIFEKAMLKYSMVMLTTTYENTGMSGKTLRYILDNSPRKKRNKLELVTVNEKSIEMNLSSWREKKSTKYHFGSIHWRLFWLIGISILSLV